MTALYIAAALILVAVGVTLFLTAPAVGGKGKAKGLYGLCIAHRGLHALEEGRPENSLPAFKAAVEDGFAIENDIHLTRDGQVVVFHDHSLKRMCGVEGIVEEMTLEELKGCTLLNTGEKIPTLQECLELVDGRVPLLIEFKSASLTAASELCTAADKILREYKGEYYVQSFFPFVLRWYRKNNKAVCRGLLASRFKGEPLYQKLLGKMLYNFIARPHFISYDRLYKKSIMRRLACRMGAFSVGWTFTSQAEIKTDEKDFSTFIFEGFIPKKPKIK